MSVHPYVHNETQCSHKPNSGIWYLLRSMRHSRQCDFQGHPRSVRVKVRRWPLSAVGTILVQLCMQVFCSYLTGEMICLL